MSSETDHPRQRTVAELLAEHGEGGATGRRRRRRASDEPDEGGPDVPPPPAAPAYGAAAPVEPPRQDPWSMDQSPPAAPPRRAVPPPRRDVPPPRRDVPPSREPSYGATSYQEPIFTEPDRSVLREPVPPAPRVTPEDSWGRPAPAFPERGGPGPERPTDVMPRVSAPVKDDLTGPVPQQAPAPEEDDDAGPSTMIGGAPVEARDWHRVRTADARRDGTAIDGGPPLPPGPVDADDEPAGLGPVVDLEKHRDGPDPDADPRYEDESDAAPKPRERRLGRASAAAKEAAAPAWAAVMVQWVAGALGGAVLWVLFRYLWRNLPVVALASAVVVTVGLVIVVRALLHNNDRRTTVFAVLVGLLLTVSPAILVLMGR